LTSARLVDGNIEKKLWRQAMHRNSGIPTARQSEKPNLWPNSLGMRFTSVSPQMAQWAETRWERGMSRE
jgi:hypothetical protein